MKIKLTPELAYLIGLWRKRRSFEGLGVYGDQKLLETFAKEALEQKLTTPNKLLVNENRAYFYHTAYKKFFTQVEEEQLERFKYLNEYAANYLAGLFDAVGEIDDQGVVSLSNLTNEDELLLLRLGFKTKRKKDKCIIEKPVAFLKFIKNYVKISKEHKIFEIVEKLKK